MKEPERQDYATEGEFQDAHRKFEAVCEMANAALAPQANAQSGGNILSGWILALIIRIALFILLPGYAVGWLIDRARLLSGAADPWTDSERLDIGVAVLLMVGTVIFIIRFLADPLFRFRWLHRGVVAMAIFTAVMAVIRFFCLNPGSPYEPRLNLLLLGSLAGTIVLAVARRLCVPRA